MLWGVAEFEEVDAVLTAKVPILKLKFHGKDIDVCINNQLVSFFFWFFF